MNINFMRASRRKSGKCRRNSAQGGATLIEMVVSFALIAMFMLAATVMLTAAFQVFSRIKEQTYAQNACDIVLDRIEGELSLANQNDVAICGGESRLAESLDGGALAFSAGGAVCCRDGDGARVCIYAMPETQGGQLVIHYFGREDTAAADWIYDAAAMQGFHTGELVFAKVNENTVQVNLTLVSDRSGNEFSAMRTISCVYLKDSDMYSVRDAEQIWSD